jgi:hypothetical protein
MLINMNNVEFIAFMINQIIYVNYLVIVAKKVLSAVSF